ncbi:MAG: hypothetical protein ACC661_01225 [Verrucomicrobiales bacterium]
MSGKTLKTALAVAIVAILALAGRLYFVTQQRGAARDDLATATAQIDTLEGEHLEQTAELERTFQREVQIINEDWSQQLAELKQKQQAQVSEIYEQINQIVYNGGETLDYIAQLEAKLRGGQKLAGEEVDALEIISAGLTHLHSQYSKPIHEFRELEQFLVEQLKAEAIEPDMRFGFLKSMFSKNYRKELQNYYKDVGKQEAFTSARTKVAEAYASAQAQMAALSLDSEKYLQDLQNIIQAEQANEAQLDDFFKNSRKMINIHQGIMKLQQEREKLPEVKP